MKREVCAKSISRFKRKPSTVTANLLSTKIQYYFGNSVSLQLSLLDFSFKNLTQEHVRT